MHFLHPFLAHSALRVLGQSGRQVCTRKTTAPCTHFYPSSEHFEGRNMYHKAEGKLSVANPAGEDSLPTWKLAERGLHVIRSEHLMNRGGILSTAGASEPSFLSKYLRTAETSTCWIFQRIEQGLQLIVFLHLFALLLTVENNDKDFRLCGFLPCYSIGAWSLSWMVIVHRQKLFLPSTVPQTHPAGYGKVKAPRRPFFTFLSSE